jgi:hypothetical protein
VIGVQIPASQPAFAHLRARLLLGELRLASQRASFFQRAPQQAKAVAPKRREEKIPPDRREGGPILHRI